MKTKILKFALPISLGLVMIAITILTFFSITLSSCNAKQCTQDGYPLYCEASEKCCPADKPYNDGHGTCFSTMAACTAGGYQCEVCHPE